MPGKARNQTTGLTDYEAALISLAMSKGNTESAWTSAYMELHPKASERTARRESKRFQKRPPVTAYVALYQQKMMKTGECQLIDHLRELADLRDAAKAGGKYAEAIRAEELRGKACGHYVERVEHTGKDGGAIRFDDPASRLEFARRVAFVLRLGENAAQTIDQIPVRVQEATT